MTLRVTVGASSAASLANLQAASARLSTLQNQLSSGRRITTPSDDPAGTIQALQVRGALQRNAQYMRNTSDAISWLSAADTAYSQLTDMVQKSRTLLVQGLNTGATDATSQQAIGSQIKALQTSALKLANGTYNGQLLFGGTSTAKSAYTYDVGPDGTISNIAYTGDSGTVQRAIGDNDWIQLNQTGDSAFGQISTGSPPDPATNLFTLLGKVAADVSAGAATSDDLTNLSNALNTLGTARSAEGAAYQRAQSAQAALTSNDLALTTRQSDLEDVDFAQAAVQVSTAQVVYQAALQSTANIRQVSLLDFLK